MSYYSKRKTGGELGKQFKYRFQNMPFQQKLIGFGSLVAVIGLFLPWISYDTNISANGFQYSTFLIGYIIFLFSLLMLCLSLLHLFDKKLPRLPLKEYSLALLSGLEIVLLGIVAFSIYATSFFLTAKYEIQFGITATMVGGLMIFIGGYMTWKEERQDAVKKTFMHMPEQQEDSNDLEKYLQRSKDKHKMLSAEESPASENPSPSEPPSPSDQQAPPNLKMFE